MQKNRRNKDNFRYERVDLARADSSDSEDDLDRVLGPSTAKGKKKETKRGAKWCGCCFAILGVLMALATLGIVIVYGTVWVPNGLKEQLIANHLYPFETNGTTNATDEIGNIHFHKVFDNFLRIYIEILRPNPLMILFVILNDIFCCVFF